MTSSKKRESIAIIGSGVSGLVAAYLLDKHFEVTVFEANSYVGGHVDTHQVSLQGISYAVDTGFIVYNNRNYPLLSGLFAELGVQTQESEMTFSVTDLKTGSQYAGTNLNSLFATRKNLLRLSFWKMLTDILRFNRLAKKLVAADDLSTSVGEFLRANEFGPEFINNYLVPMGSSIWSANPQKFDEFPVTPLAKFLNNHGLLSLGNRPQWRTVVGGSANYVAAIRAALSKPVVIDTPITSVTRTEQGVLVDSPRFLKPQKFDRVIFATHADTTLSLLRDSNPLEREILGAFGFQENLVQLHTDSNLLPTKALARASWNYLKHNDGSTAATLTYYANILQRLNAPLDLCVTLNSAAYVDSTKVLATMTYSHPVYNEVAFRAQERVEEIDGHRNTHFIGAYWGYGFHEDGAASAHRVAKKLLPSPKDA